MHTPQNPLKKNTNQLIFNIQCNARDHIHTPKSYGAIRNQCIRALAFRCITYDFLESYFPMITIGSWYSSANLKASSSYFKKACESFTLPHFLCQAESYDHLGVFRAREYYTCNPLSTKKCVFIKKFYGASTENKDFRESSIITGWLPAESGTWGRTFTGWEWDLPVSEWPLCLLTGKSLWNI